MWVHAPPWERRPVPISSALVRPSTYAALRSSNRVRGMLPAPPCKASDHRGVPPEDTHGDGGESIYSVVLVGVLFSKD